MPELYAHQKESIEFLKQRHGALLASEMGTGKTRCALVAAQELFAQKKIDRVLVLAPAAVRISWRQEVDKLDTQGDSFTPCVYGTKEQRVYGAGPRTGNPLPVLILSYALLPQARHVQALESWCEDGKTLLIADESSFLKNRTAKQTRGAARIAAQCMYRWLLTGTPIANSPLDLYGQSLVMSNGAKGPLSSFKSWWQFQARYAVLKQVSMGQIRFKQVVGYQNIEELTKRFAPYVLRREKKDCLDLPLKSYVVREVALSEATWRVYQELRKEALLCLPDSEERPEPNAAVRLLRLCQLTSGHVGNTIPDAFDQNGILNVVSEAENVSSEKLDWLVEQILEGELSTQQALIVWCRWRRERERLAELLKKKIRVDEIYGGQNEKQRNDALFNFTACADRRNVLLAQPHAGGYGLTLTAASTAVYLSNDFSFTTRIQSEDRIHRINQKNACLYIDVIATGPKGQRTVDAHVLECLRAKRDLATLTCAAWRKVLSD